jgi:hypothetical protein
MGPCICLCLQEPTDKFGLLVQKKANAVVTAEKSVTSTCSDLPSLKTAQLFLEAEWTVLKFLQCLQNCVHLLQEGWETASHEDAIRLQSLLRTFSHAWDTSTITNQGPFSPNVRNACFPPFLSPDSITVPATLHAFRHNSQCTSGINWCKKIWSANKQKNFLYNHLPTLQSDQKTATPSRNGMTFA